jgi:hypothetical protein
VDRFAIKCVKTAGEFDARGVRGFAALFGDSRSGQIDELTDPTPADAGYFGELEIAELAVLDHRAVYRLD